MNDSRKKMLEKVKAILAKTMDNGCTESEAMAALNKAREMMATYEIDENELREVEEAAKLHKTGLNDPYEIKKSLSVAIARFTRCTAFNGSARNWGICFVGLESDTVFATWLLDTLQRYVMRALREFQRNKVVGNSNHTSASFVIGCVARINEKLKALTLPMPAKNKDIIATELAKNGIQLYKTRSNQRDIDENSARAGMNAGNNARFDRPVETGGTLRLK